MAVAFVADTLGRETAIKIAREIEYNWTEDKDNDSFVVL